MFWTNFFMMLVAVAAALARGEMMSGIDFVTKYPEVNRNIIIFAICSAFGQSFIFFTIATFGPLKVAAVTTTRKIFSVLLSIFLKGHQLSALGWGGVALGSLGIAGELIPKSEVSKTADSKE